MYAEVYYQSNYPEIINVNQPNDNLNIIPKATQAHTFHIFEFSGNN